MGTSEEQKDKILVSAAQVFMKLGVKSVNMDDMSRELGISKKTLYLYVNDKNDLVHQSFEKMLTRNHTDLNSYKCSGNPIEEVLCVVKHVITMFNNINPVVLNDVKRYYPESWARFEKFKYEIIYNEVLANLKDGIKLGLYRKRLHPEIISTIHVDIITMLMADRSSSYSKFTFQDIYLNYMEFFLRGICTEKGIEYLEKRIKELKF